MRGCGQGSDGDAVAYHVPASVSTIGRSLVPVWVRTARTTLQGSGMNTALRSRLIILLVHAICVTAACRAAATRPRLNVLLIIADDLRDHVGCYGNTTVRTPNIDRLAARSVVFDRAYVQYPVCNPSRSSFLTGLRPDQTGVIDNRTLLRSQQPQVVTLPQLFKQHGYYTASFGKIFHLGAVQDPEVRNQWLDLPHSWHEARAFQTTPDGKTIAGRNLTGDVLRWCRWGATAGNDDDQPDGQNALAALHLMDTLADQPWFIGVGFHKPHDPFVAPQKYFDCYPLDSLSVHADPPNLSPAPDLAVGFGAYGKAFRQFTDRERREFLRAYYACVTFMDAQVGRLLDKLDENHLWDQTLVIFMSDHGYHLGEREWWNKNTLFDRSCRSPLMIAGPEIKPGRAGGLVEFVDLYPTVIDLCGLPAPHALAGTSFRALLNYPNGPGKAFAYTMVSRGGTRRGDSIRTVRWRYTEWSDGSRELYDHEADPEEWTNMANRSEQRDTVRRLRHLLARIRSQNP